jgi:hypothetical protein
MYRSCGSNGHHAARDQSPCRPIASRGCLQKDPLVFIDLEQRSYMVLSMRLDLRYESGSTLLFPALTYGGDVWMLALEMEIYSSAETFSASLLKTLGSKLLLFLFCDVVKHFDMIKPSKPVALIQGRGR